jgi:hypothetical protein
LRGELREQVDLFVGEGTNLWTVNCYCADRLIVFEYWHCHGRANTTKLYYVNGFGVAFKVGLRRREIRYVNSTPCSHSNQQLWLKAKSKLILKASSSLGAFCSWLICPIFTLDRLSRYEAILCRQASRILFALNALNRRKPHERPRHLFWKAQEF